MHALFHIKLDLVYVCYILDICWKYLCSWIFHKLNYSRVRTQRFCEEMRSCKPKNYKEKILF